MSACVSKQKKLSFKSAFGEAMINPNIFWAFAPTLTGWKNFESCIGDDGSYMRGGWVDEDYGKNVLKGRQIHDDTQP